MDIDSGHSVLELLVEQQAGGDVRWSGVEEPALVIVGADRVAVGGEQALETGEDRAIVIEGDDEMVGGGVVVDGGVSMAGTVRDSGTAAGQNP